MLLALRSLWEQVAVAPPSVSGGGARWRSPQLNLSEFFKWPKAEPEPSKKKLAADFALALFVSGQIDESTFAAVLAATRE